MLDDNNQLCLVKLFHISIKFLALSFNSRVVQKYKIDYKWNRRFECEYYLKPTPRTGIEDWIFPGKMNISRLLSISRLVISLSCATTCGWSARADVSQHTTPAIAELRLSRVSIRIATDCVYILTIYSNWYAIVANSAATNDSNGNDNSEPFDLCHRTSANRKNRS